MKRTIAVIVMAMFVMTQTGVSYALRPQEKSEQVKGKGTGELTIALQASAPAAGMTEQEFVERLNVLRSDTSVSSVMITKTNGHSIGPIFKDNFVLYKGSMFVYKDRYGDTHMKYEDVSFIDAATPAQPALNPNEESGAGAAWASKTAEEIIDEITSVLSQLDPNLQVQIDLNALKRNEDLIVGFLGIKNVGRNERIFSPYRHVMSRTGATSNHSEDFYIFGNPSHVIKEVTNFFKNVLPENVRNKQVFVFEYDRHLDLKALNGFYGKLSITSATPAPAAGMVTKVLIIDPNSTRESLIRETLKREYGDLDISAIRHASRQNAILESEKYLLGQNRDKVLVIDNIDAAPGQLGDISVRNVYSQEEIKQYSDTENEFREVLQRAFTPAPAAGEGERKTADMAGAAGTIRDSLAVVAQAKEDLVQAQANQPQTAERAEQAAAVWGPDYTVKDMTVQMKQRDFDEAQKALGEALAHMDILMIGKVNEDFDTPEEIVTYLKEQGALLDTGCQIKIDIEDFMDETQLKAARDKYEYVILKRDGKYFLLDGPAVEKDLGASRDDMMKGLAEAVKARLQSA